VAWAVAVLAVVAIRAAAQEQLDITKAPRITLAEFKKLFDAGDVVVIDVRDEATFKHGHIPGALSIPVDQVPARGDRFKGETKPIVTYCA
jgi:rhodanese-related sulfurtransferase